MSESGTPASYARYDEILKDLFHFQDTFLVQWFTGGRTVAALLNVELPLVRKFVADLALLLDDDSILHPEVQARGDNNILVRVAIYALLLHLQFGKLIRQVVLYIGEEPMTMPQTMQVAAHQLSVRIVDIREISADDFLASGQDGDLALALLAGGGESRIQEVLVRVSKLPTEKRGRALTRIIALGGLRKGLRSKIDLEVQRMPQLTAADLRFDRNEWIQEAENRGRTEGRMEGRTEGRTEGQSEGREATTQALLAILSNRFGAVPESIQQRLELATIPQLKSWINRSFAVEHPEDLFE
jgi:hypothetical protein